MSSKCTRLNYPKYTLPHFFQSWVNEKFFVEKWWRFTFYNENLPLPCVYKNIFEKQFSLVFCTTLSNINFKIWQMSLQQNYLSLWWRDLVGEAFKTNLKYLDADLNVNEAVSRFHKIIKLISSEIKKKHLPIPIWYKSSKLYS